MAENEPAKVLLLGLLHGQDMHGYRITDIIETHFGVATGLTRPTAYRYLKEMTAEGLVADHEEKAGNRPPRRVFHLTPMGRDAFLEMLRRALSAYEPGEYLGEQCVAFLDAIPPAEAQRLLASRRDRIQRYIEMASDDSEHHGPASFLVDHRLRHLRTELEWTDHVIASIDNT